MERVLLFASVVVGLIAFFCRFLPVRGVGASSETLPSLNPSLRTLALLVPFLGLMITLPTGGSLFSAGQRLGFGFLIGGVGALLAALPLIRSGRDDAPAPLALSASLGLSAAAVALTLLLLRASLLDGLLGVAIGWFCTTLPLLIALPVSRRAESEGHHLAAGVGMTAALAAAALLGVFRDPLTPVLAKQTWSAILTVFAAGGALLVSGGSLAGVAVPLRMRSLFPWFVAALAGGLTLHLTAGRIAGEARLVYAGLGGLLLGPVALGVYHAGLRRASSSTTLPTLALLVVASGFMASLQALQGVGAAGFIVGLWVSLVALSGWKHAKTGEETVTYDRNGAALLGLFATLLLLWRAFTTRWAGDLRGVNLTDQYALFGLLLGAALPSLLSTLLARRTKAESGAMIPLIASAALCLSVPGAIVLLFGAKSAVALLIGLALGAAYPIAAGKNNTSLLPALLAVGVALVLDQFTGRALDAIGASGEMTRADRLKWLAGISAMVAVLVAATDRALMTDDTDATEEVLP